MQLEVKMADQRGFKYPETTGTWHLTLPHILLFSLTRTDAFISQPSVCAALAWGWPLGALATELVLLAIGLVDLECFNLSTASTIVANYIYCWWHWIPTSVTAYISCLHIYWLTNNWCGNNWCGLLWNFRCIVSVAGDETRSPRTEGS